jgi:muramoyltetrapeptide carboxypeptidase
MARLIKPQRLRPGSTIAIVAPAGPPRPDRLFRGIQFFKAHGYKFKVYPQVKKKIGYLAGSDEDRAEAVNQAFADKTIDGIFAARGGYGCIRILKHLDFDIIKANPKVLVGYSDITAILLAIYKKCGLVTFHGPMTAVEFGRRLKPYTTRHFFDAIENCRLEGPIKKPDGYTLVRINGGIVRGPIFGGNLALIARMAGTGFLPSFKGKIIFLEDTEEEPYRLDAYLWQLFSATDIVKAKGFVIGEMTHTEPRYGHSNGWEAIDVIKDYFTRLSQPAIFNYPCGHGKEKITIPIGIDTILDADKKVLEFKEAGVKE